ncbi:MAG TPA: hypothetical protein VG106_14175 [Vicinamibacterales bacterium]|nr:hypothetical protein [Vicinamibacterales bacterium]
MRGAALHAIVERRRQGIDAPRLAREFHETIAASIAAMGTRLCEAHGVDTIAISGGTFQNALLAGSVRRRLPPAIRMWMNQSVPPNDGGVSLGQAAIAAVGA